MSLSGDLVRDHGSQNRSKRHGPPPHGERNYPSTLYSQAHFSSFIVLQTSVVCPVFEWITVVAGRQLQVTVLAFSCLTTTQCSMSSAMGGGSWLRIGAGVAATGCFFAAHPARSRQNTSQAFLMPFIQHLSCPSDRVAQNWTPSEVVHVRGGVLTHRPRLRLDPPYESTRLLL